MRDTTRHRPPTTDHEDSRTSRRAAARGIDALCARRRCSRPGHRATLSPPPSAS